jgi:hypothetical protein
MTKKNRYFLLAATAILVLGVGGGLLAYLSYKRAALPAGVPPEVRYVPADAALVGYANVRGVMNSELHRQLMPTIEMGARKGRHMMNEFAGIDLEKHVDHVVGYVERGPSESGQTNAGRGQPPRALMMVQGTFEQERIEQFIRDHGGAIEDYRGHHLSFHRGGRDTDAGKDGFGVGFVQPDLIAVGHADLIRRAIDAAENAAGTQNLTTNAELMKSIREAAGSTAWAVGYFDTVSHGVKLPNEFTRRMPPVRLIAAKAEINGGVKGTIQAEAADTAAAEQLRDLVRGFLSLARLSMGAKPELDSTLKSIQLSGTDKTVRLTFAVTPDAVRALAPRPPQ